MFIKKYIYTYIYFYSGTTFTKPNFPRKKERFSASDTFNVNHAFQNCTIIREMMKLHPSSSELHETILLSLTKKIKVNV